MKAMSMGDLSEYVTVEQAAHIIGRSPPQVYRYIRYGLLPAVRVHRDSILVLRREAQTFTPPPRGNPLFRRRKR